MYAYALRSLRLFLLAPLFFAVLLPAALAAEETPSGYAHIEAGHSGLWYDPARDGEGWMLEVSPQDGAILYWFTFDEHGQPRWLVANGQILRGEQGDEIQFDSLIAVHGPRFGPGFDPADAVREDRGSALLRFHDCDSGEIHFDAYGRQGSFALMRLTRTMGAHGCRPIHGTLGEPVQPHAGQSGSWYDPALDGQGFSLAWMPNGDAALVWFTFDGEGKPYWLTAIGGLEDGWVVFSQVVAVEGGRFADAFDPGDVVRTPWGRLELALDCDTGEASYEPEVAGFAVGDMQLWRLTRLASPACPWARPTLTDLYDIAVLELPAPTPIPPPPGGLSSGNLISVSAVADDGTVVGRRTRIVGNAVRTTVVRLSPGDADWQDVTDTYISGVWLSANGQRMLLQPGPGETPFFVDNSGSIPVPGLLSPGEAVIRSASADFSYLVGTVDIETAPNSMLTRSWIWDEANGAQWLPTGAFTQPVASCVSDDGRRVVGSASYLEVGGYPNPAVYWQDFGSPRYLEDANGVRLDRLSACSANARFVYGLRFPRLAEGWAPSWISLSGMPSFIGPGGVSGDLGVFRASEEQPAGWEYRISQASGNGSLAGGMYQAPDMAVPGSGPYSTWGGLLWSQDTGHVALPEVLGELEQALDWPSMHVQAISPSGEYLVLSSGPIYHDPVLEGVSARYSALLRLVPRER